MRAVVLLLTAALLAESTEERLRKILARVSEEAEVFHSMAPKMLAQETLVQRAIKPRPRFRPRVGRAAVEPPKPEYRTRELVSEYSFGSFQEAPNSVHEFRQVIAVDGRRVVSAEKARQSLAAGLRSEDDRVKKRLLDDFEKHGMTGAAADFGQVLLLFSRTNLDKYEFQAAGERLIGPERALVLTFRQVAGEESLLIFERRKAIRQALEGELWVRASDFLPLRVILRSSREQDKIAVRDEATVDYTRSAQGVLTPAAVVHRQFAGNVLTVENVFRYSPFRFFGADTEIKFTEQPK
jgi:hypothetical protein